MGFYGNGELLTSVSSWQQNSTDITLG
jgi:hypothetical protein